MYTVTCRPGKRGFRAALLGVVVSLLPGPATPADEAAPRNDVLEQVWSRRQPKYFIVVGASDTVEKPLDYVDGDATSMATALGGLGFTGLSPDCGVMVGSKARADEITHCFNGLLNAPLRDAVVVFYFSGHGVANPQGTDVWLQTGGTPYNGPGHGVSVNNLLQLIPAFRGWLILVLDACYSGAGAGGLRVSDLSLAKLRLKPTSGG